MDNARQPDPALDGGVGEAWLNEEGDAGFGEMGGAVRREQRGGDTPRRPIEIRRGERAVARDDHAVGYGAM